MILHGTCSKNNVKIALENRPVFFENKQQHTNFQRKPSCKKTSKSSAREICSKYAVALCKTKGTLKIAGWNPATSKQHICMEGCYKKRSENGARIAFFFKLPGKIGRFFQPKNTNFDIQNPHSLGKMDRFWGRQRRPIGCTQIRVCLAGENKRSKKKTILKRSCKIC